MGFVHHLHVDLERSGDEEDVSREIGFGEVDHAFE